VAAPSYVFTIARVAKMLDEDEAWLEEIAMEMEPEDGCLAVWGTDDEIAVTAFTPAGVDNLKELVLIHKQRRPTNSRE
jgi:hypothetical protein